jgi:hypothetical protein
MFPAICWNRHFFLLCFMKLICVLLSVTPCITRTNKTKSVSYEMALITGGEPRAQKYRCVGRYRCAISAPTVIILQLHSYTTLLPPHVLHCYLFNSIVLLLTDSLLTAALLTETGQSQSQSYFITDGQSVSSSWLFGLGIPFISSGPTHWKLLWLLHSCVIRCIAMDCCVWTNQLKTPLVIALQYCCVVTYCWLPWKWNQQGVA